MNNLLQQVMGPSLAGRAMLGLAVRVTLVISVMTAIAYYLVVSAVKEQSLSKIESYIVERTQRERVVFKLAKDNHRVIKKELLHRLALLGNSDPVESFNRKIEKFPDGTYRTRLEGYDGSRESFIFIGRQVNITADLRRRVLTFIDLGNEYGAAWHHRLQNIYFTAPENLLSGYWPEVTDWAHSLPADMYLPEEEYVWVADEQHNPARNSVWTGLFYDIGSHVWMASIETPVYIEDIQIATIGHDITLNELLKRTVSDSLEGAYNLIVRADGRLIAHPEMMDAIKAKQGYFDINTSGDTHLKSIFKTIKNNGSKFAVLENNKFDEYIAFGLLEEPGWYFVTVYPGSLVTEPAFETAKIVLIIGLLSVLIELIVFYKVLQTNVSVPMNKFADAVNEVSGGELNVKLDDSGNDEIGELSKTFNNMTLSLMQRDRQIQFNINMSAAMTRALSTFVTDQESVQRVFVQMLEDILRITDSEYGFIGEVHQSDSGPFLRMHAITDISWDENSSRLYNENLEKGIEFHNMETLFGAAIKQRVAVVSNDPANDERSSGLPVGHPSLKTFLGVPLIIGGGMVGMVGLANRQQGYDLVMVDELSTLFHTCANVINAFRKHRESKAIEEALYLSEERYRSICSRVPGVLYQFKVDANGKKSMPYVSPTVVNYIGLSAEQLMEDVGQWFDLTHPDDLPGLEFSISESMKKMSVWEWEGRFVLNDGAIKWLHGTSTPVKLEDDSILWDGVFIDVTEQRKVELEIERSRVRFQAMFESIPDAIVYAGPDRSIRLVNKATKEMFGYSDSELIGNKTKMLYASPNEYKAQGEKRFNKDSKVSLVPHEIKYRCKSGSEFVGETLGVQVKSSKGEILGYLGIIRDVSERTHVEAILRSLASGASGLKFDYFLNDILERLTDLYSCQYAFVGLVKDGGEKVETLAVRANGGIAENFEYSLQGTPCQDILDQKAELIPEYASKIYSDDEMLKEMGVESYFGAPLLASDGSVKGVLSVMGKEPLHIDEWTEPVLGVFSARVSLELERESAVKELQYHRENLQELVEERTQDLSQARDEAERANVAKSDFLSRMSHELRTPMNAILGFGQMLELDADGFSATQKDNVKEILEAARHLMMLINEVLDLAKIESGKLVLSIEGVYVDDVLQQCLSLIQSDAELQQIKIKDEISNKGYIVKADFTRLKQVLLNLLSNAVKYNREKGQLILQAEEINKHCLRINITDTGEGLKADEIDRLFSAFERLNRVNNVEGTGIGLVITRHLIEAMGGSIGVKSEQGRGCTFWVEVELFNGVRNIES